MLSWKLLLQGKRSHMKTEQESITDDVRCTTASTGLPLLGLWKCYRNNGSCSRAQCCIIRQGKFKKRHATVSRVLCRKSTFNGVTGTTTWHEEEPRGILEDYAAVNISNAEKVHCFLKCYHGVRWLSKVNTVRGASSTFSSWTEVTSTFLLSYAIARTPAASKEIGSW